jgi:hypothetical protein
MKQRLEEVPPRREYKEHDLGQGIHHLKTTLLGRRR